MRKKISRKRTSRKRVRRRKRVSRRKRTPKKRVSRKRVSRRKRTSRKKMYKYRASENLQKICPGCRHCGRGVARAKLAKQAESTFPLLVSDKKCKEPGPNVRDQRSCCVRKGGIPIRREVDTLSAGGTRREVVEECYCGIPNYSSCAGQASDQSIKFNPRGPKTCINFPLVWTVKDKVYENL